MKEVEEQVLSDLVPLLPVKEDAHGEPVLDSEASVAAAEDFLEKVEDMAEEMHEEIEHA